MSRTVGWPASSSSGARRPTSYSSAVRAATIVDGPVLAPGLNGADPLYDRWTAGGKLGKVVHLADGDP